MLYQSSKQSNFSSVLSIMVDLGCCLLAIGIIGIFISLVAIAATMRENVALLRLVSR